MRRVLTAFLLLTSACATTHWTKPGATGEDFADDQMKCEAHARLEYGYGGGLIRASRRDGAFNECMVNRGWAAK